MLWNWRKIGIMSVVTVLILSIMAYGTYQYLLHRYAHEIDNLLSELVAEPENAAGANAGSTADDAPSSDAEDAHSEQSQSQSPPTATAQPEKQPTDPEANEPQTEPPESQPPDPSTKSSDPIGGAVAEATTGLSLSDSEMDLVGDLPSLLGQMTSDEKLMLVKTLMKFSPSELLNLYRLYEGGDAETKAQVKEQVKAKFSAEDIELIKQMAAKYR